ncbi:hypothetical protein CRU99_03490 [Malaciobacter mytili]|uniref:DUF262 domain-containing protein n=1 Tax=Malaciobacter mytili TaxID=603050 RepID=UPI00100A6518|nr:DUF262 domain-containing protein [Malaciobacter mytili]RXI45772.1 hypothetical protein CRU99_03490 [Malaciobacter mytili]
MGNNKNIRPLKIKELFESNSEYKIPIYQRNYAWEKAQVEQLVQDIFDFSIEENKTYYIGTLVVYERNENNKIIYETIDGQQRLTTLSILLAVLKNKFNMDFNFNHLLTYESRKLSNNTFNAIYKKSKEDVFKDLDEYNLTMKNAYNIIKSKLDKYKISEIKKFTVYLLENVEILRVSVPGDTDLNHYFEIMNNRGEQLEKHEVLKADMLSKLDDQNDRMVFARLWDACSDMGRYVHYGFSNTQRDKIFGKDWNSFELNKFEDLYEIIKDEYVEDEDSLSLEEVIKAENKVDISSKKEKDSYERFISPINFQNFLLHVLRILQVNKELKNINILLDDKKLIKSFEPFIVSNEFVREFGFNLLKLKFLFDNYVLKRDYLDNSDDGEWSLLQVYKYQNKQQINIQYKNRFEDYNNNLKILLAMFHVSNPSQIYKHWLSGVLNYLYQQDKDSLNVQEYILFLEDLAKKFFKKYISTNQIEYEEILFSSRKIAFQINTNLLNQGISVENFIFNYLDYLLWKKDPLKHNDFNFTFKSSIEHFYPQHPKDNQDRLQDIKSEFDYLNCFGNLCLISTSKNSSLSNHQPGAKADFYYKSGCDSIKQKLMIKELKKNDNWWIKEIENHQTEMMKILGLQHVLE